MRRDTAILHEQLADPATSIEFHAEPMRNWEMKWRKSWDQTTAQKLLICNTSAGMLAKGVELVTSLADTRSWSNAFSKGLSVIGDLSEATSLRHFGRCTLQSETIFCRLTMRAVVSRIFEKDPDAIDALMLQIAAPNSLWRKAFRIERP